MRRRAIRWRFFFGSENREKWNVNVGNVKMVMMAVGFALRCGCICVCSSLSFPYLSLFYLNAYGYGFVSNLKYQISNIDVTML